MRTDQNEHATNINECVPNKNKFNQTPHLSMGSLRQQITRKASIFPNKDVPVPANKTEDEPTTNYEIIEGVS